MGINISYVETGATSSGNSAHRVGVSYETDTSGATSGYHKFRYRFFIDVTKGNYSSSHFYASWSSSNITVSSSDTGYGSWSSWITVNSGQTSSTYTGYCGYINTGSSHNTYAKSTVSYTAPTLKWTVSYNANGGSGAPSSQTKYYNTTLTLSSTKPTRTGYTFLGWSTSSTATSATYSAGGSYTSNSAATLYAVWSANTYTVTFDANGGSGAPSSQSYTYASSGTITLSSTKPTRTGYTFKTWNTNSSGTGTSYAAGATFSKATASNTTLYAIWTANKYTVTFDANGGIYAPSPQTYTYASSGTITLSSIKPQRDYYVFAGWGTSSTATTVAYASGATFSKATASDTTLYAIWTPVATCTITYNMNGGTGAIENQTHSSGYTTTLSTTIPTKDNCLFLGWSTSSSSFAPSYFAGGKYINNSFTNGDTITLYAVWYQYKKVHIKVSNDFSWWN